MAFVAILPDPRLPAVSRKTYTPVVTAASGKGFGAPRGFGRPRRERRGGADPAAEEQEDVVSEAAQEETARVPKSRGKARLARCEACEGKGMKLCPICKGTGMMVGFTRTTEVPCVPCNGKGTFGRACPECAGVGFRG